MSFKKIFFLGTPYFAAQILDRLIAKGICFQTVISMPDQPAGRGYTLLPTEVKKVALAHQLSVLQPNNSTELRVILEEHKPDLLLVVAYGMIFPADLVDAYFFLNIHASLLPLYRGPSPIQSALADGCKESGVTLMRIGHKVDNGDILATWTIPIEADDTTPSYSEKLIAGSIELVVKQLAIPLERWKAVKQDELQATFTRKLVKNLGQVDDITLIPVEELYNRWRAYQPWPGLFTFFKGKRVKLVELSLNNGKITIIRVQVEGKPVVEYDAFMRGYGPLL